MDVAMSTPTVSNLRRAIQALNLPVDPKSIGLSNMTPERQQTVMLALLMSFAAAHLNNHSLTADQVTAEERYMLNVSALGEATGGDATSNMGIALFYLNIIHDIVAETGRDSNAGNSPAPTILALIDSLSSLLVSWADATESEGFVLDGRIYHVSQPDFGEVYEGLRRAVESLQALTGRKEN